MRMPRKLWKHVICKCQVAKILKIIFAMLLHIYYLLMRMPSNLVNETWLLEDDDEHEGIEAMNLS
jgi:hypothetical protein